MEIARLLVEHDSDVSATFWFLFDVVPQSHETGTKLVGHSLASNSDITVLLTIILQPQAQVLIEFEITAKA